MTVSATGSLRASIDYYCALLQPGYRDPALHDVRENTASSVTVPTLTLCGGDDIRRFPMRKQGEFFSAAYEYTEIPDSGHFLHREQPEEVTRAMLRWFSTV